MVLDLDQPARGIWKLMHGASDWAFGDEPIIDDERGFNLAPAVATGLFSRLKAWARPGYAAWCPNFANA